jgi:hypothetical protein
MKKRKEEIVLEESDSFAVGKVVQKVNTHRSAQFTIVTKSDLGYKVCKLLGIHKICDLILRK